MARNSHRVWGLVVYYLWGGGGGGMLAVLQYWEGISKLTPQSSLRFYNSTPHNKTTQDRNNYELLLYIIIGDQFGFENQQNIILKSHTTTAHFYFVFPGIFVMFFLFLLTRDQLVSFYNHGLFFLDMTLVLYMNIYNSIDFYSTLEEQGWSGLKGDGTIPLILIVTCAWAFYAVSVIMYSKNFHSIKPILFSLTTFPVILRVIGSPNIQDDPPTWLCVCFGVSVFLALEGVWYCSHAIYSNLLNSFSVFKWMYRMYGGNILVLFHWRRLNIPVCMGILFLMLFTYNLVVFLVFSHEKLSIVSLLHLCVALSCNTTLSTTGCCFVIYKISCIILLGVKLIHREENFLAQDDPVGSPDGMREGFGFFFLALYTGLCNCETSRKLILLELIFYLLISALVKSMFEVTEPILMAVASQHARNYKKHVKVVTSSICLLLSSIFLSVRVYALKEKIPFVTPNVITIAQITAALILYFLYLYEAHKDGTWEQLDDYVYYVNGTCRLFEFAVISAVLCYRLCDFSLEWTIFQGLVAALHIYFNIWMPAKEGLQSLRLRFQVNQKLNSLPSATEQEIEDLQDVCAICLDELHAAKVTPCRHYFHSLCLKKWLNVQDKCPMCHTSLLTLQFWIVL